MILQGFPNRANLAGAACLDCQPASRFLSLIFGKMLLTPASGPSDWQEPNRRSVFSCQISTGQENASRMWNKGARPSPQCRTQLSWWPCSWSQGQFHCPSLGVARIRDALDTVWGHSERLSIMSCNSEVKKEKTLNQISSLHVKIIFQQCYSCICLGHNSRIM